MVECRGIERTEVAELNFEGHYTCIPVSRTHTYAHTRESARFRNLKSGSHSCAREILILLLECRVR
jgi:hypothetical protein